jgi:HK97 gp10 family phage protein
MARVTTTLELRGTEDVAKALAALAPDKQLRLYQAANLRAARIAKEEITARAPRFSGNRAKAHPGRDFGPLAKVVKTSRLGRARNKSTVLAGIGTDGFYAQFLEYGTPDRELRYRFRKNPERRLKRGVEYPRGRMTPQPFIQPAIDASVPRIIEFASNEYGRNISNTLSRWIKKQQKTP